MKKRNAIFGAEHNDEAGRTHVCPKTGRIRLSAWAFPLVGIVSFFWFLIRVLPKPSRATYPCQRVAAPLAASFVMWIAGLFGTAFAYRRWQNAILQQRRLVTVLCAAAALVAGIVTVTNMPHQVGAQLPTPNDPIGVGQGIHPGRVVWVHNPGATDWAGFSSTERWYDDAHTDPLVVERMVSQSIRELAGESTDEAAWDAIFRYFNLKHGRGNRGYYAGEKIMIKLNLATCNVRTNNVSLSTWEKSNTSKNLTDVAPQMVRALLKHLVYTVKVNQSDITVGDSGVYWPNCYLTQIRAEYPNVIYQQSGSGPYRTAAGFSSVPFNWSTSAADGKLQDYLPTSYAQAPYLINFSVLKGHSAGITLCGKNDYGSLIRLPNGWLGTGIMNYYNLHDSLPNAVWSPGMGHYRAIVDLMGHPKLGGKTLLYLVDGLYGGYYSNSQPFKWNSAPFNGDWPSSIFASQDPVAIDSVGYDFLNKEWPNIVSSGDKFSTLPGGLQGGAEDYLHEAALANNPLSGTFYDPDKDGIPMQSLGVHEHWNDSLHKQYSRNLGLANGIEMVSVTYDTGAIQRSKLARNDANVLVAGAAVTAAFQDYFYVESDDRFFGIRVNKVANGLAKDMRVNVSGPMGTNANDERYIAATIISSAGIGTIAPVHMNANALGGGNWNYDPATGAGQSGILGASGNNSVGLLVRASGSFTKLDNSTFTVNDGSTPVKCVVPSGITLNPSWTHVAVTGISSCEKINGELHRLILVRQQSDITPF